MARAYGPNELGKIEISKEEKFDYWLSLINKDLLEQNEHRWFAWHSVFTEVELSEEFCQEIAAKYIDAGWYVVAFVGMEQDGERVSHFVFFTKDSYVKWLESEDYKEFDYHLISSYETVLEWKRKSIEMELKEELNEVLNKGEDVKMAISPKELIELKHLSKVDKYVKEIDKELRENEPMFEWFEAQINCELPVVLRNAIAEKYIEVGWHKVYHHTTSENGERPGLTAFVFLTVTTEEVFDRAHKNNLSTYWQVSRDGVEKSPITIKTV